MKLQHISLVDIAKDDDYEDKMSDRDRLYDEHMYMYYTYDRSRLFNVMCSVYENERANRSKTLSGIIEYVKMGVIIT